MKASIILSTYNRPQALLTVLEALNLQTIQDFEVCIADDGSTKDTQHKSLRISSKSQPFQYCMPGKMTEDFVLHQLATMPSG